MHRMMEKILKEFKNEEIIFLVEGKKDFEVLKRFGASNIIKISHQPLFRILEKLDKNKRVAILTDYDKNGKKIAKELNKILQKNGIKIDNYLRKNLKRVFRITKIEELKKFLDQDNLNF